MIYHAAMISLIVNADDLGANPQRDRGIFEAFAGGIVSSASLLANGASSEAAAERAVQLGLPVGVHLNLSEGKSLSGSIPGLTVDDDLFPGKQELRRCLACGSCDPADLLAELSAQVERVRRLGLEPDHLDSHQHCQLFPCVAGIMAELAGQLGIDAARRVRPMEPARLDPDGLVGAELAFFRRLSAEAQAGDLPRLRQPDGLWGMPLIGRLNSVRLCHTLEELPDGCWELMCHPGYLSATGAPFDGPARETELRALTSARARSIVEQRGIHLLSFGELSCAS
jgi:predicted glycoside hydrolase/deacetylase ChbG (UPF0249 family)